MPVLISSVVTFLLVNGCASPRVRVAAPDAPLRLGDRVLIQFTNRPSPEVRQVVDAGGNIYLPLIGKTHVAGMTLTQAKGAIEASYPPAWPPEPEVSVSKVP